MCDDKDKHDPVIFNLGDGETISSSDLNAGVISESGITIGINSTQLDFMASLSILKSRDPNKNYSYKLGDINFSDLGSGKLMGDTKVSTNWEEVAKEAKESDLYAVYNAAHYRLSEAFIKNRVFTHVPNPDKEPENK